jgi:excisionase family DNA binding protein
VADRLQVHPITVYRLIKQAKLPVFRIGRILRFDSVQLENWMLSTKRVVRAKNHRRKNAPPVETTSAEYFAYPSRGKRAKAEKLVETVVIDRAPLVRAYFEAGKKADASATCERCGDPRKKITALLMFSSIIGARSRGRKQLLLFCRGCFAELKKIARSQVVAFAQPALEAASRRDRADR